MSYEFFPQSVRDSLPPLYSQEHVKDPICLVKFFFPMSSWTFYAIEGSPVDENGYYDTDKPKVDYLFYGFTVSFDNELGYVSLSEIAAVEVVGLKVERDVNFQPTRLSVIRKEFA